MARVTLSSIGKRYPKQPHDVVEGVSLDVAEGEFVVLLGPSGCGKTTTLRIVAGLEKPTRGELLFDGRVMNEVPPDERNVGMVFQNYALYPHMTVFDNLAFGLRARKTPKQETARLVREMAELLEIEEALDRRPKELSGGQRQRVALGRALVRRPAVFLMDEPLSNLDAALREQMRLELSRLHETLRVSTLYVTHDQAEALTLADRVVVMDEGRIRQVGPPSEVYAEPADTFVAGFIGSPGMNIWTLPWEDGGTEVLLDGALRLPRSFLPAVGASPGEVTVGVRPEHLSLAGSLPADGGDVELWCEVDGFEDLGSHGQLRGWLAGRREAGCEVVARLPAGVRIGRGEQVGLYAPAGSVQLFDARSGRRISSGALVAAGAGV
jgi:ABC-type sugar transport system ATPase subunit